VKAWVFKRVAPAVIARQDAAPSAVLEKAAETAGAHPIMVGGQDFTVHEEGGRLVYQDAEGLIDLPLPRLAGRHQHGNAGTAIAALRAAGYGGLPVVAFEQGMLSAEWPARMQRLTRGHLVDLAPAGAELWLDGGHNADGARAIAAAMADLHDKNPAPLMLIAGLLATKDLAGVLAPFAGLAQELVAVPIASQLAARPAQEISAAAARLGLKASAAPSVEQALRFFAQRPWPEPPRILIYGSLYLAGEALAANGTPPA
jgi:dihydrofolate synthase/folylpolyglutamate synthase